MGRERSGEETRAGRGRKECRLTLWHGCDCHASIGSEEEEEALVRRESKAAGEWKGSEQRPRGP